MKKGFSLITAIIFLVLIATISALSLAFSTQSVKQTSDLFLKTQAELLLRSGTEYAMLKMSDHNYSASCLNQVNMTYNNQFDINISIMYIGKDITGCPNKNILDNNISTTDSNRTVILDTFVSTKTGITTEPIHLHRRTIQKP
ncbi:MAG: type II secretion system protein [Campylobacteraceae bacterium]|nr:type II secretion system protein [Campylobacteraceae bacterium]